MYHPTVAKLDSAASDFHNMKMMTEKNSALRLAGQTQQALLSRSPYPGVRFLHEQWVWALGHIGLLHQLIRWFKLREPETQLVLVTKGANNPYFLNALSPYLTIVPEMTPDMAGLAMSNAVYFGCPDGANTLVNFYKMIERECVDIHLLSLSEEQKAQAVAFAKELGVEGKYVALHARYSQTNDPDRNPTEKMIRAALDSYISRGYSVICTGLDNHPDTLQYRSVTELPDPHLASFLLSANCDQFVGSDSGAWTIAHAYQKPVELMNDYQRNAWIYSGA